LNFVKQGSGNVVLPPVNEPMGEKTQHGCFVLLVIVIRLKPLRIDAEQFRDPSASLL